MALSKKISIWWGPPKDFTTQQKDRRISWLELFYDLVYVIAIARLTHHLTHHLSWHAFLEFAGLFALVFWGWLNGSLHHDLHGNQGLRTRLMMLWQMMIIAVFSIIFGKSAEDHSGITIVFMLMQLFITYQWWSVGFYDRSHRKYSKPYMVLFLSAFALMGICLWQPHLCGLLLPIILICNYTPPFVAHRLLVKSEQRLDLSSSMFERLGLFTIIIFGELVFGVINGVSKIERLGWVDWIGFALATGIVFSLWWIFFTFVSTREVKKGFARASALELLYIPALIALCVIAACLPESFNGNADAAAIRNLMQYGIAAFLFCIVLITILLEYPAVFVNIKRPMRLSLLFTAFVFLALGLANFECDQTLHWIIVIIVVVAEIAYLNYIYYSRLLKEGLEPVDVT
jgi:low temperature requirement protein LtrA